MGKTRACLLALSLASLTVIAGLAAYFTGSDAVTNTFGSTTLQIRVVEPSWKQDPTIVPEQRIDKDPYIVNTDKTPAYVFMQVTVPVQEILLEQNSSDAQKGTALTDAPQTVPLFRFLDSDAQAPADDPFSREQQINAGWYPMPGYPTENRNSENETVSLTYLYAWTGSDNPSDDTMAVLYPDQTTGTPLFDQVMLCNAREDGTFPGSTQHIRIEVFGIQTDYLKSPTESESSAADVWQHLSA